MSDDRIQLVCFDLGNVLVRLTGGLREACAKAGVAFPERFDVGAAERELDVVMGDLECGRTEMDAFFDLAASRLPQFEAGALRAIYDAWIDGMQPGAEDLLRRLADDGVRTACLSNTSAGHWHAFLDPHGPYAPLGMLDAHFASHLVGVLKPDPRIYAHLEAQTGVEPSAILFFDDHPPNVEAARGRRWRAEWIDPGTNSVPRIERHLGRYGLI